jgi:hypothetical protein
MNNIKTFESFCYSLNESVDYLELRPLEGPSNVKTILKFGMSDLNAFPFIISRNKVYVSDVPADDHFTFVRRICKELNMTDKQVTGNPIESYIDYMGRMYKFDNFIVICFEKEMDFSNLEYEYIDMIAEYLRNKFNKRIYLGSYDGKTGNKLIPLVNSEPFNQLDYLSAQRTLNDNKLAMKKSNNLVDIRGSYNQYY